MFLAPTELQALPFGPSPIRGLRSLLGASSAEEACEVALTMASITLNSPHGFVILENLGYFCDEAIPHSFIVRAASGTYGGVRSALELGPDLLERLRVARRSLVPSFSGDLVIIPFHGGAQDWGCIAIATPEPPKDDRLDVVGSVADALGVKLQNFRTTAMTKEDTLCEPVTAQAVRSLRRTLQFGSRTSLPTTILLMAFDELAELRRTVSNAAAEHYVRSGLRAARTTCRATDGLFRLDQDHLLLILPATNAVGGLQVAQNMMRTIGELHVDFDGGTVASNLTIAVSPTELGELNPRVSLQRASRSLHEAQRAGGNRIIEAELVSAIAPN
ncbi:MAG: diguanylate cyclase [Myxococcales bacterium]|nr:diguanylate cyclase [Myxococcales bacterium]